MRLIVILRKIKAKLTGKPPCCFETKHGHDLFECYREIKNCEGFKYVFLNCTRCLTRLVYDELTGKISPL